MNGSKWHCHGYRIYICIVQEKNTFSVIMFYSLKRSIKTEKHLHGPFCGRNLFSCFVTILISREIIKTTWRRAISPKTICKPRNVHGRHVASFFFLSHSQHSLKSQVVGNVLGEGGSDKVNQ